MEISTIGIDLSKTTFHVIGLNARGKIALRKRPERNFEIVAGKASDRDGHATRFAFVHNGGSKAVSAVDLALRQCGINEAPSVTVLTDGDAGLRAHTLL